MEKFGTIILNYCITTLSVGPGKYESSYAGALASYHCFWQVG